MQWKSPPQGELSGVAAKRYPVVPVVVVVEAVDPVAVEVVGKNIVRAAAATAVGIGRHLDLTVGVVAAEVGQSPVVVLAG